MSTPALSYVELEIVFEVMGEAAAEGGEELPEYLGSTLRGAFGQALREDSCLHRGGCMERCEMASDCVYGHLFEPPIPVDAPKRLRGSRGAEDSFAPKPFVITPLSRGGAVERGDEIRWRLRLFGGAAMRALNRLSKVLPEMAETGLGMPRLEVRLSELRDVVGDKAIFANGSWRAQPGESAVARIDLQLQGKAQEERDGQAGPVRAVELKATTPLNFPRGGDVVKDIDFAEFVYQAADRLYLLASLYGNGDAAPDAGAMARRAREIGVERVKAEQRTVQLARYSSPQGREHAYRGMSGRWRFEARGEGDNCQLGAFLPVLKLGEVLHAGRRTNFGLGAFRVSSVVRGNPAEPTSVKSTIDSVNDEQETVVSDTTATEDSGSRSIESMDFDERLERMRTLARGDATYGGEDVKPGQQASEFWFDHMLDQVVERTEIDGDLPEGGVDFLVSLVGFSPATTVMAYRLLQPDEVLAVYTPETADSINVIHEYLVAKGELSAVKFKHHPCDPGSATDIYDQVRQHLDPHRADDVEKGGPNVIIDITGGKKVMSATAALAAWQLDLPLAYLDSEEYDREMRRPVPGTEILRIFDNPTALFGDQEMATATQIFNNGAFDAAEAQFEELAERLAKPVQARLMLSLSRLYRAWCDLDFESLDRIIPEVHSHLQNPMARLSNEHCVKLDAQLDFLTELAQQNRLEMLMSHRLLAGHYAGLRRHDFATLLYYRTMEGCFDVQLSREYDGFDTGSPDYGLLPTGEDELESRFDAIAGEVFDDYRQSGLPSKIGFMSAAFILHAIEDPLLQELGWDTPKSLKFLRQLGDVRNRSVLAHGFERIAEEDSDDLRTNSRRTLAALWELHRPEENFEARFEKLKFVRM